ncbi:hypothetical protein BC832DRAFT_560899 [Gaertneriomyces semiglobifer]|nr:hypothetical protein BC832DRAFT_560899 [Gaertneriomyces semiglobifer]
MYNIERYSFPIQFAAKLPLLDSSLCHYKHFIGWRMCVWDCYLYSCSQSTSHPAHRLGRRWPKIRPCKRLSKHLRQRRGTEPALNPLSHLSSGFLIVHLGDVALGVVLGWTCRKQNSSPLQRSGIDFSDSVITRAVLLGVPFLCVIPRCRRSSSSQGK